MTGTEAQTPRKSWRDTLLVYFQPRMLCVLLLGIASGFPSVLVGSTLTNRLQACHIDIKTIGIFALVMAPYTYKFLFAPAVDSLHLTRLRSHLAHRKSWCYLSQILLVAALLCMAFIDPAEHIVRYGMAALMVATFSAMQDIVLSALRIEIGTRDEQGATSAAMVGGYRIGMLMSGGGALILADQIPWECVYYVSALVMAILMLATVFIGRLYGYEEAIAEGKIDDPEKTTDDPEKNKISTIKKIKKWLFDTVIEPFIVFLKKPAAIVTLVFIATYKLGVAVAGNYASYYYKEIGYSLTQIGGISKTVGLAAILAGTFIGGIIVKRFPIIPVLAVFGSLQLSTNLCYIWLGSVEPNNLVLSITIILENVTAGMNASAFVAFLSQLCSMRYTATHYALLSSLAATGKLLSAAGGKIIDEFGWTQFFLITIALGIPALILLAFLKPALEKSKQETS